MLLEAGLVRLILCMALFVDAAGSWSSTVNSLYGSGFSFDDQDNVCRVRNACIYYQSLISLQHVYMYWQYIYLSSVILRITLLVLYTLYVSLYYSMILPEDQLLDCT